MKAELYQWIKNLAVFYIVLSAVVHLAPDSKYEKYIRFFMGLLLILMMSAPVFSLLGKGGIFVESFWENYNREDKARTEQEAGELQRVYLERGYQISRKYMEKRMSADAAGRRERHELPENRRSWNGKTQGEASQNGDEAVDDAPSSGAYSGSGCDAGLKW